MPIPREIRTERLRLRRWEGGDATVLLPVLEANAEHLRSWIPPHVYEAVPLPDLARRLEAFAESFDTDREWRFALFTPDGSVLLGEVSLFPRDACGRVPMAVADRVEIGYWLRSDLTGRGLATEAARAMIEVSGALPGIRRIEIRCDARNVPSAAIPRKLGFRLDRATSPEHGEHGMVWALDLPAEVMPAGRAPGSDRDPAG